MPRQTDKTAGLRSDNGLRAGRRAGVRDVAGAAGVSVATVSRVFNRPDTVRPDLRARVTHAAETLHYLPNAGARAMSLRRTMRIGALIPSIDHSIFAAVMTAMQRAFAQAGYTLVIGVTEFDLRHEASELKSLLTAGVDGLVLTGARRPAATYRDLADLQVPFVLTSIHAPDGPHTSIGYDNELAGRLLARHLVQLGHRTIGMVAGPTAVNDRAQLRKQGVLLELESHGLSFPGQRVVERPFTLADGRIGFSQLIDAEPAITAVICGNDVLALGALFEAQSRGLAVPDYISIAGFDGLDIGRHVQPGLTTIDVHRSELGQRTAEVLLAKLAGIPHPHATLTDMSMIVRASTGQPRAAAEFSARANKGKPA